LVVLESAPEGRLRYPLHALLLVGLSWCFYAFILVLCAVLMLPCVPLAPLFVVLMIGLGGLLSSVHAYARSVATPAQTAKVQGRSHGQIPEAPHGTPQAS
jgi:hypothetical protein